MNGQTLGPYKILEQIGAGGMATVYKAYQAAMDRFVAVKILPPNLAQDPQFSVRFAQEARTIARLEHPFILPVYDSGNEKGIAYIVMRYMEFGTLGDILNKGRPNFKYSARLIQRIAEALDYAHSQGIIHRDIKPNNILVDKNGQPYLTDFGIAKILESAGNLTGSGIIGTPSYMSPEQGQGMPVDARSDIYSLGVVLYELTTGRLPFNADTPMAVLFKHIQEPLPPPSSLAPDIPPALEHVILKALEKNREARYRTAGEFAQALEQAVTGTGPVARVPTMVPGPTIAASPSLAGSIAARPATGNRPGTAARPGTRAARPPVTTAEKPPREERQSGPNWLLLGGCGGLILVGIAALAVAAIFAVPGLLPAPNTGDNSAAATETFVAAYNSAVQTAAALSTSNAQQLADITQNPVTPAVTDTAQPGAATDTPAPAVPSDTPTTAPTETPGEQGCNDNAKYDSDITIPDNTVILPGVAFVKTWRVINTGTCTWDTTYTLRFSGGVQMSGPGSVNFTGTVSPGSSMDITVNLVAPNTPGNYTGQWRLNNPTGNAFGINGQPLTVVIVVPATPTPVAITSTFTPTPVLVIVLPSTVSLSPSASGGVQSNGALNGPPNVGDVSDNRALQGFLTFDLSSIPNNATITGARIDLSSHDTLGSPFSLGCLRVYQQNYGTLDGSDFFSGTAGGALARFCSAAQLSDPEEQSLGDLSVVQSALASDQLQLRLQFNDQATNSNGIADVVRPTPKLIVTYTTP